MHPFRIAAFVLLGFLLICAGCATTTASMSPVDATASASPVDAVSRVPTGQWAGTGTYAEYEGGKAGQPEPAAESGTYPTTLSISEREVEGHRVLEVEILSKSGKGKLGSSDTHLIYRIAPVRTLSGGVTLYALVDFAFNNPLGEAGKPGFKNRLPLASGSCVQQGRTLVLNVTYMAPNSEKPVCFWDTFAFEGDVVRKTGRIIEGRNGDGTPDLDLKSIDWVEELKRVKQ